jgi:RNA polymerase sigma factor (sigma-70 family)
MIPQLRQILELGIEAALTDGELLECFVSHGKVAALEALVLRLGPMVWGVCRRALSDHHDAEDAFQATFLVLIRRAASIMPREMVANWLYGVAHKTALKARATTAKRRAREKQVNEVPESTKPNEGLWNDIRPLLDHQLSRLPDKYRVTIVLCDLEEKTRKETARQLGLPEGTVASRLMRARKMLAKRLARDGLTMSGGALAVVLSAKAAFAKVPIALLSSTIKAAILLSAKQATAGVISLKVAALTEEVLKAMFLTKIRIVAALILTIMLGLGSGLLTLAAVADDKKPQTAKEDSPDPSAVNASEKGLVQTTATILGDAFGDNDAAADEKFTDKQVEISGKCGAVRRVEFGVRQGEFGNASPNMYVLKMGNRTNAQLWFRFDLKSQKQLAALKLGQDVSIRCLCAGRKAIIADGKPEKTGNPLYQLQNR